MTEEEKFAQACRRVIGEEYERDRIGILKEKTTHAVLKTYVEPDCAFHETPVGKYVADVCRDGHITEVQSCSLAGQKEKLAYYLAEGYTVDLVFPIPAEKRLFWIDPASGETSAPRKVGKKGSVYDIGRELCYILPYLAHPAVRVVVLLLAVDEYRRLDGWGNEGKRGAHRADRIPKALQGRVIFSDRDSFRALIPPGLPGVFTAKDFRKATKTGVRVGPALLSVLCRLGLIEKCGTRARAILYRTV